MKSERRHELQTNYLADHLGTAVEGGKPFAVYVVAAVAALVVGAVVYGVYTTYAASASAAAWGDYYFNIGSGDAEVFQQVAEDHAGTAAANWSKQAWADNQMLDGLDKIHSDRKGAEATIDKAIEAYQQVLSSSYEPDLKNRAAMGLGQAYEAIGKLDDAAKYYKQVSTGSQDGFAAMAGRRLAWITSGEGKSFYEWFATTRTTKSSPPNIPTDLSKPPTAPDISFPATAPVGSMPPATGLPAAPADATPVDPATATPTTETPSTPAPSTPAPGAATQPAETSAVPATPVPAVETPAVPATPAPAEPAAPVPTPEPPK